MASYQLPPLPQKLAIFDQFVPNSTVTLVLKEGLLSKFDIKALDGTQVLNVTGSFFSLHRRKTVCDTAGNHLFDITKKLLHIHTTFALEGPGGQQFMEVKSKFALVGAKIRATFVNASTGQQVALFLKGNWFDTSAEIVDEATGATVARIDRKMLNARELVFGKQTYYLTVAPGADMALLAAMCICLDEKKNESS
ncbi:Tubby C-terminal-like domain-containing protein [Madurella fahalii]|uniref:Tubby C-terminal-like domain-containing protein n=1 Tax=Madurella fahalii TaxID=1157608 RepID=A0ABQ0GC26_9PEZI